VLVSIGDGGQLKRLAQLTEHLRSQELTPAKSVSFDSIGHGGDYKLTGEDGKVDSYKQISVVDDKKILEVIPLAVRDVLEDGTSTMSDNTFIAPVLPELKCPNPVISLYHCFSADKGIVGGKPAPSVAERIKALAPDMKVRGIKGTCLNPGPTGELVEF
jgi:hypothetical protein